MLAKVSFGKYFQGKKIKKEHKMPQNCYISSIYEVINVSR